MNMCKKKINTMLIVMNLILMPINNSYYMFNFLWTTIGGAIGVKNILLNKLKHTNTCRRKWCMY